MESDSIEIKTYRGEEINQLVPTMNEWILAHYKSFPFLYYAQGEVPPTHVLAKDPQAFVLLAEKKRKAVGLLMAHPLTSPALEVKYSPFRMLQEIKEKGFDISKILYAPCFLLAKEERMNKDLIHQMYIQAVALAKKMGKSQLCYFTTEREEDHPLKPSPYIPPEPWDELPKPFRSMGVTFELAWPTLQVDGSIKECSNVQALYIQDI